MVKVSQVANGIYQIHPDLNFMFSLSYLVLGEKSALIDPGSATQAKVVLKALEDLLQFDTSSLQYIIPTHLHIDHGGGAGYLAQKLPQSQVVVFERYARHLTNPKALIGAFKVTFGDDFATTFGEVLPVPDEQMLKVEDGHMIDLESRQLEIVYTRGHAHHHICLLDSQTQGLFCGDTLGMYFPDVDGLVVICPEGFDLVLQLESIDQLGKLAPKLLFYAHEGTGRRPVELMHRATQELNTCGEIVSKSLKNGEDSNQIEHRLNSYFKSNVSPDLNYEKMHLDLTVAGYSKYFEKIGQLPSGRRN